MPDRLEPMWGWSESLEDPRRLAHRLRGAWEQLRHERGPEDAETLRVQIELATALRMAGELQKARETVEEALRIVEQVDPANPLRLVATLELGRTLLALSRLVEATEALEGARQMSVLYFGEKSPQAAFVVENELLAARARGDFSEAERLRRGLGRVVAHLAEVSADRHWDDQLFLVLGAGAGLDANVGASTFAVMLSILRRRLMEQKGEDDPFLAALEARLGSSYLEQGELEHSLRTLRAAAARVEKEPEPASTYVIANLAHALAASPELEHKKEGVELAAEVVARRDAAFGARHPQTLYSKRLLARAAAPLDAVFAARIGEEAAEASSQALGRGHLDTLGAYEDLAGIWELVGALPRAREVREENARLRMADEGIVGSEQPPVENLAGRMTEPFEVPETMLLAAPGGALTLSPERSEPEAASAAVRRTAHVELDPPGEVEIGGRFEVVVQVDCGDPDAPGSGELVLELPPGVDVVELRTWLVVSRHFEIEGEAVRPLVLDLRQRESPQLRFPVRARVAAAGFPEEPEVRVLFSYNGWLSGEASLLVPLVGSAAEAAR